MAVRTVILRSVPYQHGHGVSRRTVDRVLAPLLVEAQVGDGKGLALARCAMGVRVVPRFCRPCAEAGARPLPST